MLTLGRAFSGRENNLTFIRLLAALAVIYGHAYAVLPGHGGDWVARTTGYAFAGGVAVDLFFLISGFLVTGSLLHGGMKHYVLSRFLRIYPALWVHLLLVTFVLGSMLTTLTLADYLLHPDTWNYFKGLAGTYRGAFFLPGVFTDHPNMAVNGSIWSVLIEVWLYVTLLSIYIVGVLKRRWAFNVAFVVVIVAVWQDASWIPSSFASTTNLHVCMMFFIGVFLYLNRDSITLNPVSVLFALCLAGITLGTDRFPYAYVVLLVSFFCLVCFQRQFSWMDRMGDYSYGVYLYGWPAQQVVLVVDPTVTPLDNALWASLLALACAALSWHLIEKPAMKLKRLAPQLKRNPELSR